MRKKLKRYLYAGQPRSDATKLRKHPYVVPVVTLISLVTLAVVGFIVLKGSTPFKPGDSYIVKLSVAGEDRTLPTRASNVGELLNRLQITLGTNDVVEPDLETPIVEDNFRINVYRARPVVITDGDKKVYAVSAASTPRTIARQAGVTVYPEDRAVSEPVDNILRDGIGEKIAITRSVPITLNLYGTPVPSRTLGKTVGEVLAEKNIKLSDGETVAPAANTPVSPDQQIFVLSKDTQIQVVEEPIPPPVQTIEDASLSFGTTVVRQAGTAGKKVVTYAVVNASGEKHKIQEITVQDPVVQIVARGKAVQIPSDKTGVMNAAGIAAADHAYVNYIVSRESGWRPDASGLPPGGPYVGAYGLCQANPGKKMASAGGDWLNNPVTQLRWCSGYAKGRYGSWAAAYSHWQSNHSW